MKLSTIRANARMSTSPLTVPRTMRKHTARGLTSLPAGKMVPIAAVPLLREDAVRSGRLRFSFEMMETAEVLMNAINVRVLAYLVPTLAFDRFHGSMDQLNRSYQGEAFDTLDPVPYIETVAPGEIGPIGIEGVPIGGAQHQVYSYLGMHARADQPVNTMYLEAYNQIWNFRAKNRSPKLTLRDRLDKTLAPAFWMHERFKHIVPDFDQARMDGEVALTVGAARVDVKGIATAANTSISASGSPRNTTEKTQVTTTDTSGAHPYSPAQLVARAYPPAGVGAQVFPEVYVEMADAGIALTLANIELARKTQAFAKLREQYHGHTDEWLINLLMDGLTVPEQAWAQPMLIGEKQTIFGMSKRYATDAGNLNESVVNGATFIDMALQLPRVPTGGVVMLVAEIMPDQLFERQRDPFLHAQNVDDLPAYLRDTLDPEKVEVVPCEYVDIDHDTPNATFGYAPLNYKWNIEAPHIGGRFYRPAVDAGFDEDRQRIWAVETANPTLAEDFYLCTNMHTKPFVVTNQDPFEVVIQGDMFIEGNTVFGPALIEASDDYAKVLEHAPVERIEKP